MDPWLSCSGRQFHSGQFASSPSLKRALRLTLLAAFVLASIWVASARNADAKVVSGIRLNGGWDALSGRLEITTENTSDWYSVAMADFTTETAKKVCKRIGHSNFSKTPSILDGNFFLGSVLPNVSIGCNAMDCKCTLRSKEQFEVTNVICQVHVNASAESNSMLSVGLICPGSACSPLDGPELTSNSRHSYSQLTFLCRYGFGLVCQRSAVGDNSGQCKVIHFNQAQSTSSDIPVIALVVLLTVSLLSLAFIAIYSVRKLHLTREEALDRLCCPKRRGIDVKDSDIDIEVCRRTSQQSLVPKEIIGNGGIVYSDVVFKRATEEGNIRRRGSTPRQSLNIVSEDQTADEKSAADQEADSSPKDSEYIEPNVPPPALLRSMSRRRSRIVRTESLPEGKILTCESSGADRRPVKPAPYDSTKSRTATPLPRRHSTLAGHVSNDFRAEDRSVNSKVTSVRASASDEKADSSTSEYQKPVRKAELVETQSISSTVSTEPPNEVRGGHSSGGGQGKDISHYASSVIVCDSKTNDGQNPGVAPPVAERPTVPENVYLELREDC